MKSILIVFYFAMAIFLFVAAISMYRHKKKMTLIETKKIDYGPIPLWYIIVSAVSMFLILGKFNELATLLGQVIFIIAMGLMWKRKIEQK